jgi:hypothetical protein
VQTYRADARRHLRGARSVEVGRRADQSGRRTPPRRLQARRIASSALTRMRDFGGLPSGSAPCVVDREEWLSHQACRSLGRCSWMSVSIVSGAGREQLDRVRPDAQAVALSATDKSVTIVEAVSRGNVRHLRMQVRDVFREGRFRRAGHRDATCVKGSERDRWSRKSSRGSQGGVGAVMRFGGRMRSQGVCE